MANLKGGTTIGGYVAAHLGNLNSLIQAVDGSGSGIDSDTVDGKHSSDFAPSGYGLGTTAKRLDSGTDLNIIVNNGWYDVQNPINGVSGLTWHSLFVIASADSNYVTQIVFPMTEGNTEVLYIRQKRYDTWSSWKKIWTENNDGSGSGLNADLLDGYDGSRYHMSAVSTFTSGDWNTLTTHGVYKIQHDNFLSDTNAPPASYAYGILNVIVSEIGGENRILQIYYPHLNDNYIYWRMYNNGGWTSWKKIWANGTGNGSGLDADLLDGYHANTGTAANTIPVRNSSGVIPGATYRIEYQDTRSANHNPFDYTGVSIHLKQNTTDGLNDGGSYHGVLHLTQWRDSSGGRVHQLGFTDNGNIYFRQHNGSTWTRWQQILSVGADDNTNGKWDYGTTAPTGTTRLNYSGYLYATRVYNAVYNDYAEFFEKGEDNLEPGDIISKIEGVNKYGKSKKAYDKLVVGVYSDSYGHCLGGDGKEDVEKRFIPVGLAGRVKVKVIGKIEEGDLITTSDIPGVGMKAEKYIPGTIIGKALESYNSNEIGKIYILIQNI